jgi:hypothetical protein
MHPGSWGPEQGKNPSGKEGILMTADHGHTPSHTHEPAGEPEPRSGGWTGYAAVNAGFIFLIVVVVLWFVATYFLGE